MNLFQQYGIKEVADVIFYSINKIGDEEFYTPVLYLDTLKVSTIEKTAQKVSAQGGLGNKKLITWNYGKELTLNLEDALFSPALMSMIWGGTLNSVLSDITSTIVKCNVANKYGEQNYSTKAYPSPALNDREKDILFRAASMAGFDVWNDSSDDWTEGLTEQQKVDIENSVAKNKSKTNITIAVSNDNKPFTETIENDGIITISFGEYNFRTYSYYSHIIQKIQKRIGDILDTYGYAAIYTNYNGVTTTNYLSLSDPLKGNKNEAYILTDKIFFPNIFDQGCSKNVAVRRLPNGGAAAQKTEYIRLPNSYYSRMGGWANADDTYRIQKTNYINGPIAHYNRAQIIKHYYSRLPQATIHENNHNEAMPQSIINQMMLMLHTFNDIGHIETEMYDVEVLDRMEKCIVKSRHGLTISRKQQLNNLKRYYLDDRTSSYTIYYDPKTMLPLLPYISDQDSFGDLQIDETTGQVKDIVDNNGHSVDKFKIKIGTVYYKWTRSVKYKSNDDTGILGRSFVINADTFPDYYKIVGETYIRNRKTGKNQRYQFVINRAQVSSDTNITLEAEGDPTTFSMQIDVLTPPNDVMMELKQYDVEEDKINGGFSVVPQKSEYTYTPSWREPENMVAPKNDEIY